MKKLMYVWIIFVIASLFGILSINGVIRFGNGLGDLVYLFALGALSLSALIVILIYSLLKTRAGLKIITLILLAILLYFIYSFTVGRGVECPWDGTVFQ